MIGATHHSLQNLKTQAGLPTAAGPSQKSSKSHQFSSLNFSRFFCMQNLQICMQNVHFTCYFLTEHLCNEFACKILHASIANLHAESANLHAKCTFNMIFSHFTSLHAKFCVQTLQICIQNLRMCMQNLQLFF